jgi:U3 small nucleolar RNA-associated protein 25
VLYFRRFQLRGVAHLVFYAAPEQAQFYAEMVNLLSEAEQIGFELGRGQAMTHSGPLEVSSLLLFTVYEKMALERIVGKDRCEHLLSSPKSSFMFR